MAPLVGGIITKPLWEAVESLTVQIYSFTPFSLDKQKGFYPFDPLSFWLDATEEISLQPNQSLSCQQRSLWTLFEVLIKAKNRSQLYSQWHIPCDKWEVGHEICIRQGLSSTCTEQRFFCGIPISHTGLELQIYGHYTYFTKSSFVFFLCSYLKIVLHLQTDVTDDLAHP